MRKKVQVGVGAVRQGGCEGRRPTGWKQSSVLPGLKLQRVRCGVFHMYRAPGHGDNLELLRLEELCFLSEATNISPSHAAR